MGNKPEYRISFGELEITDEAKGLIHEVVESNWVSGGPMEKKFEENWNGLFGYRDSIAVSSGTDADIAACMTLNDYGAKRGDDIIAPALGFAAVGNSILAAGFTPVFVDIDRETLNINSEKIEEKITPKTRAIMAVHTMGKPCDMDRIMDIADTYDLKVLEDCCEAHGAKYKERFVGGIGDVGAFSFYVAHVLACGGGGMCSTNNDGLGDILRSVKSHGRKSGELYFDHIRLGLNFRMGAFTGAIGVAESGRFGEIFEKRKGNLNYLLKNTEDLGEYAHFTVEEPYEVVSPHAFSVTLRDSKFDGKKFHNYLQEKGIDCKRNFGSMPTQHGAFDFLGYNKGDFPEAEFVGDNGAHFGVHQKLSSKDLDYCVDVLHEYFKKV